MNKINDQTSEFLTAQKVHSKSISSYLERDILSLECDISLHKISLHLPVKKNFCYEKIPIPTISSWVGFTSVPSLAEPAEAGGMECERRETSSAPFHQGPHPASKVSHSKPLHVHVHVAASLIPSLGNP